MRKIVTRSKEFARLKVQKLRKARQPKNKVGESSPRVTNETVAEVREDVLKSARKLVYPLTHSKHRVLITSTALFLLAGLGFVSYMVVSLYKLKSTSRIMYKITQILPFPIARVGGSFVAYENYLFEVERYIFYYNNIEKTDFKTSSYKPQLIDQEKKILDRVVNMAYIRRLAAEKKITVSDKEIDEKVNNLKNQNRLGNNNKVFVDTLRDFYNWDVSDFRRSIRNDILTSKVLGVIDLDARSKANSALDELKNGADFGVTATKYSDDINSKDKGGVVDGIVSPRDRNVASEQVSALAALKPGEHSAVINLGYGLEIIKKLEDKEGGYSIAHILVTFKPIDQALEQIKAKDKAKVYIKL